MENKLEHWQRLSPLSVIFFLGKTIVRLLKDALPIFAPMLIFIFASGNRVTTTSMAVAAIAAFLIGGAVLQFWFFKFRQVEDKILINDGIFQKNRRVIRFDRVQNINVLTPIYFRPFGLVTLQIETAGSKGNEADLAGIPVPMAEHLRELMLQHQATKQLDQKDQSQQAGSALESRVVATASLRDVVAYGVSSNSVFLIVAVLAPVFGAASNKVTNMIEDNLTILVNLLGGSFMGAGLLIVLAVIILMFLLSIVGAIYRYYGYELSQEQTALKRRSGLITRFEESLKLVKVQAFTTQSNFIGRMIKRQNVILGQVTASSHGKPGKQNIFIVPARTEQQLPELLSLVFAQTPNLIPESKIDKRYILKTWIVTFVIPITIAAVVFAGDGWLRSLVIAVVAMGLALPLVIKRWSMFRFGFGDGYGFFKSGLFGFKRTLFPLYKVQYVEIKQSPLQRRRDLATLRISLASESIVIPYIPMLTAELWLKTIKQAVVNDKSPWF